MGHAYASTFQKYMNQQVQSHVQAAFLGVPSEDALMNILSQQVIMWIRVSLPTLMILLPQSDL